MLKFLLTLPLTIATPMTWPEALVTIVSIIVGGFVIAVILRNL